jgi:hypothetical protein
MHRTQKYHPQVSNFWVTPSAEGRGMNWWLMLKEDLASEVLEIRVLHPPVDQSLL